MAEYKRFFKQEWKNDPEITVAYYDEDEDFHIPVRDCPRCGSISCSLGIVDNGCSEESKREADEAGGLIGRSYGGRYQEERVQKEIIADNPQSPFYHKAAKPTDPTNRKSKSRKTKKRSSDGTY